jgi:membrane fusion protein, multidrug efflux system
MSVFKPAAVFVCLFASSVALLGACSKPTVAAAPEVIRPVQSVIVGVGPAAELGAAGGVAGQSGAAYAAEIRPQIESRLGFRVGGKITARLVELGASVRKGQPLMKLDATDLQLAVQASSAQIAAAKASDEVAQANLRRVQELAKQGFVSAGSVDAADGQAKAARATLQAAQASGSVQTNASRYAVLVADAAGVVTALDAEIGQVIAAGTPVIRVSNGAVKDAVFAVPESQLSAVRSLRGQSVAVISHVASGATAVGAANPLERSAVIRDIAAIADPISRSYLVKATLAAAQGAADLPLGATATVVLPPTGAAATNKSALLVPLGAIVESQGKPAVWRVQGGVASKQVVTLGAPQGDAVAVTSGISAGAEIITAGTHTLTEGQKVKSPHTVAVIAPSAAAVAAIATAAAAAPAVSKP